MTILESELKAYHAETVDDTDSNGGRRSNTAVITSGAVQNVFPHVFKSDRATGLDRYRKVFYTVANDDDETLANAQPFFHHPPSSGDHYLYWHQGDYDDTQGDITGSERRYGSAFLSTAATAGGSTLVVTCTHADQTSMFVDGDPIMVSDKLTPSATSGNEELHTISGTPVVADLQVTITIGSTLANSYAAGSTSVSSGIAATDIECSVDSWAETAAGDGTFDEATYPLSCDNLGTVFDAWTLTFTDATNFTVAGAAEGSIGSGTTAGDFAPANSGRDSKPYFTLPASGWAGTWAAGDTITFTTIPAEISIWETLTVPAGAAAVGNAGFYSYLDGETA